jgi:hypothetical protein
MHDPHTTPVPADQFNPHRGKPKAPEDLVLQRRTDQQYDCNTGRELIGF